MVRVGFWVRTGRYEMGKNDSSNRVLQTEKPLALRTLGWMFVKTVVFCAFVCVVVLGMAEFVSR